MIFYFHFEAHFVTKRLPKKDNQVDHGSGDFHHR
jgi:hypothetical protein